MLHYPALRAIRPPNCPQEANLNAASVTPVLLTVCCYFSIPVLLCRGPHKIGHPGLLTDTPSLLFPHRSTQIGICSTTAQCFYAWYVNILYSCPILLHSHVSYPGNTHRRVKKLLAKPWLANIICASALTQMREWFMPLYMVGRGRLQLFGSPRSFADLWSNSAHLALVSVVSLHYRRRYRYEISLRPRNGYRRDLNTLSSM